MVNDVNDANDILTELQRHSEQRFGFKLHAWEPIELGWLNLKWKLNTDQGDLLLKIYNERRYHDLGVLTRSLEQQQRLFEAGIPCPELITSNGEVLHRFCENYMVIMKFSPGIMITYSEITQKQIYDLGVVTGKMHHILNDGSLGIRNTTQFIPPSWEDREQHWHQVMAEARANHQSVDCLDRITMQLEMTRIIDITIFSTYKKGWVHRDLWRDNLLFQGDRVSALLDFDRLNYDYIDLDVARAILSMAYFHHTLHIDLVAAFLEGYRSQHDYSADDLITGLTMLWYMESVWWIHSNMTADNVVQNRFAEEIVWLTQHLHELPTLVGHL